MLKTTEKQRGGVTGRGFLPGQSGNPGGRPKGFAVCIKERCGENYERLVEGLYLIAFGKAAIR